ncbi:hypothetical protein [Kribbella sp. NPDC006257]|uniref:hypothetical protein n=1 Tax=Kribbella sp. NPDC006257 TaxID=3156738 RepID=UPI0033A39242
MSGVKRAVVVGVVLCASLIGCSQEKKPEPVPLPRTTVSNAVDLETDKAAVTQAFTAYREALLAKNGKAAAALLTADSLAYYARLKKLALSAPEAELRRVQLSEQLAVLFLRLRVRADDLRRWSPTELGIDSVENDQSSTGAKVSRMSTGAVDVSGDTASVLMKLDGKETGFSFSFWRESGHWKFRMLPLLESGENSMRAIVQERHLTNRTFIDRTLAARYPDPAAIALAWRPLDSQLHRG